MNPKFLAAQKALDFVKSDIVLGIGTGSTTEIFIKLLAESIAKYSGLVFVSTSSRTTNFASQLGLSITPFDEIESIDLTIDGADEVDNNLNGIKGGGGALLYEKIIAKNSRECIWIVDSSKLVQSLGAFPLPVEVVPFACKSLMRKFAMKNLNPKLRLVNDKPYVTDSNNYIIDCKIEKIDNPINLELELKILTGVVEVGLFNNIADKVIVGYEDRTEILKRN